LTILNLEDALSVTERRDVATGKLLDRSLAGQVSLVSLAGDGKHSKATILNEKE
jgi:hypothetical protein